MASIIKTKNSSTAASVPTTPLAAGELAVNTADKKLYVGDGTTNHLLTDGTSDYLPSGTDNQTLRNGSGTWESTSDLVVDSTGNVGIGTPSAFNNTDDRLNIDCGFSSPDKGITLFGSNVDGGGSLTFKDGTVTGEYASVTAQRDGNSTSNSFLSFKVSSDWQTTAATERMRISSSGDVGIGGSSVTNRRLAVSSGVDGLQVLVQSTGVESGIAFNDSGSTNTFSTRLGSKADDFTFTTSGSERMRIDSTGNVGIGNTSPDVKLVVVGSTRVTTSFIAPSSDTKSAPAYTWNTDEDTGMFRRASNAIGFTVGGSEIMYMSSSGVARIVTDGNDDRIAGTASEASATTISRFITCSQAEYNGLTKNANTLYIIV